MMQRNISRADAIRQAYAALQSGDFAAARDAAAPVRNDPSAALLHALGRAGSGDVAGAAAALHAVADANPAARHPVHDLVDLLRRHHRPIVPHLEAAAALRPHDAGLLAALGAAQAEFGPVEGAVATFHRAAARAPDAAAWSNLGKALAATGAFEEAEHAFAQAAALAPDDPQLGLNRAVARLKSGRLVQGWELFRARHRLPGRAPPPPGPELRGLDGVEGRRILLLHDEGFGDTIQFVRYLPLLEARGARASVHAPPALARLLASNGIPLAQPGDAYDAWCRIPDLPGLFRTTLESIPAGLPYLRADPALVATWAARLAPTRLLPDPGRKIGLVWAGAARRHDPAAMATDRQRSILPGALGPLLDAPGIAWVNLQQGATPPPGVIDPMPGVRDFADTAAIIAGLDSVVSVDTAVAHLAAAMGTPVLLLDRHDGCWRWLHGQDHSPWYPGTLRIIRQEVPGDWASVLQRAAARLAPDSPTGTR